jgi:NAD(P)-dependent dehydrogenase (short-subunit alcohol dehydrogenase family)
MKNLHNQVVAISGAGSGIGRALAHEFAQHCCLLSLSDINLDAVNATAAQLHAQGTQVITQQVDVGSLEQVTAWAERTRAHFGRINVVVNNAGVALSGTVGALSMRDYEWIMQINFWGVVYGSKVFLPHLEASGSGHIVNISSVFGLSAQPLMSGYNASKFAVRGFTESLRQDLDLARSCVSASCVHPGGIKTNIAQAARVDASVAAATGKSNAEATREFESSFITTPAKAAQVIVRGVLRDQRRILIGPDARLLDWVVRLMPALYQRLFVAVVRWRKGKAT